MTGSRSAFFGAENLLRVLLRVETLCFAVVVVVAVVAPAVEEDVVNGFRVRGLGLEAGTAFGGAAGGGVAGVSLLLLLSS
jgi:hypothetical protein